MTVDLCRPALPPIKIVGGQIIYIFFFLKPSEIAFMQVDLVIYKTELILDSNKHSRHIRYCLEVDKRYQKQIKIIRSYIP